MAKHTQQPKLDPMQLDTNGHDSPPALARIDGETPIRSGTVMERLVGKVKEVWSAVDTTLDDDGPVGRPQRFDMSGGHEPWSPEAEALLSVATDGGLLKGHRAANELFDRFGYDMAHDERAW